MWPTSACSGDTRLQKHSGSTSTSTPVPHAWCCSAMTRQQPGCHNAAALPALLPVLSPCADMIQIDVRPYVSTCNSMWRIYSMPRRLVRFVNIHGVLLYVQGDGPCESVASTPCIHTASSSTPLCSPRPVQLCQSVYGPLTARSSRGSCKCCRQLCCWLRCSCRDGCCWCSGINVACTGCGKLPVLAGNCACDAGSTTQQLQ
jgi:hypothetical protein